MKFAVAGLLAFLAVSAQGSAVYPYAHGWEHSAPITQYSSYPAVTYAHASPISYAAHVEAPKAYAYSVAVPNTYAHIEAPHAYAAHAYSVSAPVAHAYVAAPHIVAAHVPHEATYTAANRGSVHTAPLPGHAESQTSLNLAPAPGTH